HALGEVDARADGGTGKVRHAAAGEQQPDLEIEPGRGEFRAHRSCRRKQPIEDLVQVHGRNLDQCGNIRSMPSAAGSKQAVSVLAAAMETGRCPWRWRDFKPAIRIMRCGNSARNRENLAEMGGKWVGVEVWRR